MRLWIAGLAGALGACAGKDPGADDSGPRESAAHTAETDAETGVETGDSADSGEETGEPDSGDGGLELGEPFSLSARPRNLLVLSIDTLRRDALGAFSGADDSPTLDALLAESVLLEQHRSCSSWTYPGAICAMTGTRAEDLGFAASVPDYEDDVITVPEGTQTLASVLLDAGYRTRLVVANGYLGFGTGLATGFEDGWVTSGRAAAAVNEAALAIAAEDLGPEQPWLLHVHYVDPHSPYSPPEEYLTELETLPEITWDLDSDEGTIAATNAWGTLSTEEQENLLAHLRVRYEGEVRYLDDRLAELLGGLDALGLLDDTLIMVWTDHGEQLFEHGGRGHAASLFGEETDGVAAFWSRDLAQASWSGLTLNEDLPLTALTLLGLEAPEQMTGLLVGTRAPEEPVFASLVPNGRPPSQSVTVGDAKLIYSWTGSKNLYRRDTDPDEQVNLWDEEDPEAVRLWELLLPEVRVLDAVYEGSPAGGGSAR